MRSWIGETNNLLKIVRRRNWFGHVIRQTCTLGKDIPQGSVVGSRKRDPKTGMVTSHSRPRRLCETMDSELLTCYNLYHKQISSLSAVIYLRYYLDGNPAVIWSQCYAINTDYTWLTHKVLAEVTNK